MVLNTKHLRDAESLLARGDYRQASEKLCDAVAQAIKVSTRDWGAEGPRDMRRLIEGLFHDTGDRELLRLFSVVESLNTNAREGFMSGEAVQAYAEDAKALLEKLDALSEGQGQMGGSQTAPAAASAEQELEGRQQDLLKRIAGLSRREVRKEVIAEMGRIEDQLQRLTAWPKGDTPIPGFPASRIASLMQRSVEIAPRDRSASQRLGLYTHISHMAKKLSQ